MFKVISFTKSVGAAPATQQITDLGFEPKGLILWSAARVSLGEPWSSGLTFALGMSDGLTSRSMCNSLQDSGFFAELHSKYSSGVLVLSDYLNVKLAEASVTFLDDAIELTWTTNDANAYHIHGVVFGGEDLQTKIVEKMFTTSSDPVVVTGVGFQPDAVLLMTTEIATVDTAEHQLRMSFGAMDASGRQASIAMAGNGGYPVNARSGMSMAAALRSEAGGLFGGDVWALAYLSMDDDGFTLTPTDVLASGQFLFASLCVKGNDFYVGSFEENDATGVQSITDPGFEPEGALLFSVNGAITFPLQFSIGAMDESAQAVASAYSAHGGATTSCKSVSKTDKCIHAGYAAASLTDEAEFESLDDNGFSIDWTTQSNDDLPYAYLVWGVLGDGEPEPPEPSELPYVPMIITEPMDDVHGPSTLQSQKVPWAHQSKTLNRPGWLGKNARIKSTG